jgi:hypothetical protein
MGMGGEKARYVLHSQATEEPTASDTFPDIWNDHIWPRRDKWHIVVSRTTLDMPHRSSMRSECLVPVTPQPLGFPNPWHWFFFFFSFLFFSFLGSNYRVAQRRHSTAACLRALAQGSRRPNTMAAEQMLSKRLALSNSSRVIQQQPASRAMTTQGKRRRRHVSAYLRAE